MSELSDNGSAPLNDFLCPFFHSTSQEPGSTDVGDVSWQTPTAQISTATWTAHSPGHSWQNVSGGKTGIAQKVLAGTAIDLITRPELLEKARAEFKVMAAKGYDCPIEPDAVPVPVEEML